MNRKHIGLVGVCLYFLSAMPCMAKLYLNGSQTAIDPEKISKRSAYKTKLNTRMVNVRRQLGVEDTISSNEIRTVLMSWAKDNDTLTHRFDSSVSAMKAAVKEILSHSSRLLDKMSNGEHSFRTLGPEYFVACKMVKVPAREAKLIFFNQKLANKLRLKLPKDPGELEAVILDKFAVLTEVCGEDLHDQPGTMFATRYMDSAGKNPEEDAMGDGRAVWSGEIQANIDGRTRPVDVVLKGIGKTSLEWQGHKEESHKDGLQSSREGIHSYMISQINQKNHIDSTQDLAVIELTKLIKKDQKYGDQPATITVRLGQQVRMGHLSYWSMNETSKQYTKMFNYSVNRALNRPVDAMVDRAVIEKYLELFVRNLAVESARYNDLMAMHGSLTRGNRTTEGLSIDNGTWQYLDGYHMGFASLGSNFGDQTDDIKMYIKDFFNYTGRGNEDLYNTFSDLQIKSYELFDKIYQESLLWFRLRRIGYTDDSIEQILKHDSLKSEAVSLVNSYICLLTAAAKNQVCDICGYGVDARMFPAKYDMRSILKNMVSYMESIQFQVPDDDYSAFESMFDKNQMRLWDEIGVLNSILLQQNMMFENPQHSDLYRFFGQLRDFQNKAFSTLGVRLRAADTRVMNEAKRPNAKTGRYVVSEFNRIKNERDSLETGTFYLNETISTMVQSQFVDPACTPTHRLRPSESEPRDEVFEGSSPLESPDAQFQSFGGSKIRGDSMSQVFY